MFNQNQIQNKIPSNSIRLQKSNSEANHNNKRIYKETKHYMIIKKNKIPREKIIQNNHYLKQKQKSITNFHQHIQSNLSPFCKICGSINYINIETNKIIETIKPHNYYYSPEFSITSMIKNLKNKTSLEFSTIFSEFKGKKINSNLLSIRNKIINRFIDYSKKILISKNTIFLTIILMDVIILKKNINVKKKMEQISLGCYFLSVKFLDLALNSFGIREYQYTHEIAFSYSLEQIRKIEVNCLINVQYNLGITNFINVLQIFLANGILLKKDTKMINTEQSLKNIYFLINKISENLIFKDMKYIQYNQFNMACAILYLSRNISKLDPWPKIFVDLYNIIFDDFLEEYNYVNNFYENNILIQNLGNKKRQRNNSTCKNINMKRISFNSTFNNNSNKTLIQNGNISNKANNIINENINNNVLNKKISQYNEKQSKYYNFSINNNNNNSLICDTTSNFINYFTNNDSSKKNYNNSGGKNNSQKKSNEYNSKESLRDQKIKLLNSSSKYIRTHHKLIKNNHQIAFNQSMEMPRKTWIFQNKYNNSRSKKIDNDRINSNRSQRSEKHNYKYEINKNSYKYFNNDNNLENDKIYKEDNLFNCKKYSEKKNKFKKILNNSEIQTKKKNNSQSNLLAFNIKKSASVKLIVDNSKKNNLSNYSNGKIEKFNHNINNNNSTSHKENKNIKNNINCYYSNVKITNKDIKNRYLYYNNNNLDIYKNNNNNNSTIKKEYDMSKEYKDILGNISFIAITDSYNINSQKKTSINNDNNDNIKIIDNNIRNNKENKDNIPKNIDSYQNKNNIQKNRLSHIKYNSCINHKINNINLYDEKSFGVKKELNISHKAKHVKDNNNNNLHHKNYNTNIILNKQNNKNIIIKINLVNKKNDNINRNHLIQKNVKKINDGIGIIKKIKINNYNKRRKETSKRKRIDSNISSYHHKNNNSNNNSSLVNQNNRSNANAKNNSDGYKLKNSKIYQIKNNNGRYNADKRSRNYSMINQKKLKSSNSSV